MRKMTAEKKTAKKESKKLVKVVLTEDFYVPGEDVILEPGDTLYIDPFTEDAAGGENPPETNVNAIDNPEADIKAAGTGTFTEDELDWVDADDILEGDDCPDCDDWTDDDEADYIEACRRRAAARRRKACTK